MNQQTSVRKVVQRQCSSNLTRAAAEFGQISSDGTIPIVLCPKKKFFGLMHTIPTGVTAILASNGADKGEVPPGTHLFAPWVRCLYMVPNQACTFNYDVVACPTQDNVMVQVDVTIVFRITNARQFCFGLGAQKFNDMLQAVCEESIRTMVREVNHKVVYELRSSAGDSLLSTMNKKFQKFGVIFVNSTITNVLLPKEVAHALQRITQLNQDIKEHKKKHEFDMKTLNDQHDLSLQELQLHNERLVAELEAEKVRISIELETKKGEMEKQKELGIIQAHKEKVVGLKKVNNKFIQQEITTQTSKQSAIQQAMVEAEKKILQAEHWSENKKIASEAELIQIQNKAKVLVLEGEAEMKASESMKESRKFALQTKANEAFKRLASRGKVLIGGNEGQGLINQLVGTGNSYVDNL